ncbi:hypothetical protein O181_053576 [Austropuccinia psidii MF-1]|uniref:Uncharacterized protein n=1 Tax=Austropuccinia psidii MF-1 TaxID=1389203 RepID=A0A9Q3E7R5_9BASI|nr:hypothetical protein [Austropuccinia psidii MF-1]
MQTEILAKDFLSIAVLEITSQSDEATISSMFPNLLMRPKPKQNPKPTAKKQPEQPSELDSDIISFVLYLLIWLHLECGISQSNCRKARDMIVYIIQLIARVKSSSELIVPHIPSDLQMIEKHFKLQFELDRYVCCPKCYALYDIEVALNDCDSKLTINSAPCGTELFRISKFKPLPIINFKTKHNQVFSAPRKHGQIRLSGQPCLRVPYANFVSQGLSTWLEWFINIPGIENEIEQWATSLSSKGSTIIFDVMQAKG